MIDVRTTAEEIWENNPHLTSMRESDCQKLDAQYNHISKSNGSAYGFYHSFHFDMEEKLGIKVPATLGKGDIHLSDQEKQSKPIVEKPYVIIDAGHKMDFTAKHWGSANYQSVVDRCPDVQFIQIGTLGANHYHKALVGKNIISMVGKTTIRELILLVYHSALVISPISFPLHLSQAVPFDPRYGRRPCICLYGGREPQEWLAMPSTQILHSNGLLSCNMKGGCWKSRTVPLHDGDAKDKSLCLHPVQCGSEMIPQCMSLIRPEYVSYLVQVAMQG